MERSCGLKELWPSGTRSRALRVDSASRLSWARKKSLSTMCNLLRTMAGSVHELSGYAVRQLEISRGIAKPKERIPCVEGFAVIEAERAKDLAGKFDGCDSRCGDDTLVCDGWRFTVEVSSTVPTRSEIFAAVAGVVKVV